MLYILTAVHNRYSITEKFINNLLAQTYKNYTLILIDDGSTDGTDKMVKQKLPNSIIIYGNGNLWWGGALHKAFEWVKNSNCSHNDFVLTINDDTRFDSMFFENAINLLEKQKNILLTACGYSIHTKKQIDGAVNFDFKTGVSTLLKPGSEGNCASTRALFFRVEDFLKIGGFHPILLPHYGSDYEFTIRAWRKGIKIISNAKLNYEFDDKTTGEKDYTKLVSSNFFSKIFSKRAIYNPVYKISFILLACPLKYIPIHLFNQISRYFKIMFNLTKSLKRK